MAISQHIHFGRGFIFILVTAPFPVDLVEQ